MPMPEVTEVYEGGRLLGTVTHYVLARREVWVADARPGRAADDALFGDVRTCRSDDEARTHLRRWHGLEDR